MNVPLTKKKQEEQIGTMKETSTYIRLKNYEQGTKNIRTQKEGETAPGGNSNKSASSCSFSLRNRKKASTV